MTRTAPHRLLVLRQLSRARQRLDLPDGTFTAEELRYLRSLPAVVAVSAGRIRYTEAFKRVCMRQYRQGKSPARIFREAGLDSALIGYKRIERCIARWRNIGMEETPEQLAEDEAYERDLDRWRQAQTHMRTGAGVGGRRAAASASPVAPSAYATSGVPASPAASAIPASSSTRMVSAAATSAMGVARNSNSAMNPRAAADQQSQPDRRQSEDLRDVLISQQIRRIVELERTIEAMRAACTCGACR
ncbi:HTH domain-containing protein [Bifidobacterium thermophilum]|uniref:HTH domain-containing protein n=1 Tax=Bifidobacterium thermophilum TaxID=33905 RepID=UPI0030B0A985